MITRKKRSGSNVILLIMSLISLLLVLLSALAHSSWNMLLKKSDNKEIFVWWLLVTASFLLFPLGAVLISQNNIDQQGWWLILGTVILHIFYFLFLGRSYIQGDLSLVYPLARGIGPMLTPFLAVVFLREQIHTLAITGALTIVLGIYLMFWWTNFARFARKPSEILKTPGIGYAILTGVIISMYSLVDKKGVASVHPFLYMYLLTLGTAIGLTPYILLRAGWKSAQLELKKSLIPIIIAGLLTYLAYGLVLTALSLSKVSYVAPTREIGIVIGVLMGVVILKENFTKEKIIGSLTIMVGVVAIAVSP